MNYLELVNDFLIETDFDNQLATVAEQQDDALKATKWIADAWVQIQRSDRWSFMWYPLTITTEVGVSQYEIPQFDFDESSFRNDTTQTRMAQVGLESIRYNIAEGSPRYVALYPNRTVKFAPTPVSIENVGVDSWDEPVVLTDDYDVPAMDPSFHKAIVWIAISNYAREQGNEWSGLYQVANREFAQIYSTMQNRYLAKLERKVPLIK